MKLKEVKNRVETKIKELKIDIGAIYYAYKRPDTPIIGKIIAIIVVGYALSPIDLIPDFIPILGYLDDLILLPLGIILVIKLIPNHIMAECRIQSEQHFEEEKSGNWVAGGIIIAIWIWIAIVVVHYIFNNG